MHSNLFLHGLFLHDLEITRFLSNRDSTSLHTHVIPLSTQIQVLNHLATEEGSTSVRKQFHILLVGNFHIFF